MCDKHDSHECSLPIIWRAQKLLPLLLIYAPQNWFKCPVQILCHKTSSNVPSHIILDMTQANWNLVDSGCLAGSEIETRFQLTQYLHKYTYQVPTCVVCTYYLSTYLMDRLKCGLIFNSTILQFADFVCLFRRDKLVQF